MIWKVPLEAPMSHIPVMAGEVLQLIGVSAGHVLVDLTVGAGGHLDAGLIVSPGRARRFGEHGGVEADLLMGRGPKVVVGEDDA